MSAIATELDHLYKKVEETWRRKNKGAWVAVPQGPLEFFKARGQSPRNLTSFLRAVEASASEPALGRLIDRYHTLRSDFHEAADRGDSGTFSVYANDLDRAIGPLRNLP
jgi:hypothetical protein